MKLVPAVRFPVTKKKSLAPSEETATPDTARPTVTFYLRSTIDDDGKTKRYFYECGFEGCHGCGCPSFTTDDLKDGHIPSEVLEHMARHSGFAHWRDGD